MTQIKKDLRKKTVITSFIAFTIVTSIIAALFLFSYRIPVINTGMDDKKLDMFNGVKSVEKLAPTTIGYYNDTSNESKAIDISGDFAYIADGSNGLEIINISDPTSPVKVNTYPLAGSSAQDVEVHDGIAFIATGSAGLYIINVSDPLNTSGSFKRIGYFSDGGNASGIHVVGDNAYLSDGGNGLHVISIQNLANPIMLSTTPAEFDRNANNVFISGTLAFAADGNDGLEIFNIRDPYSIKYLGKVDDNDGSPESGYASDVKVLDGIAFVADGKDGIEIVNVSDPGSPYKISSWNETQFVSKVEIFGHLLLASTKASGI
ncbi:MAG: LVIVD repeat-containing protein, partial [Promethearchaeota archaeon]